MIPPQIPSKILLLWIHIVSICYYCLRAGIPSRYVTSQLGQLSLPGLINRVPASDGVKAGLSALQGGR